MGGDVEEVSFQDSMCLRHLDGRFDSKMEDTARQFMLDIFDGRARRRSKYI